MMDWLNIYLLTCVIVFASEVLEWPKNEID